MKNIRDFITIFKREKPISIIPNPNFQDNWKQDKYEKNVNEGLLALQKGKNINIMDDGRGYELALEIKQKFILEYQKQLSEKIKIDGSGNLITITIN